MRSARLREHCHWAHSSDFSACVRGAAGDRVPESWVSRSRLREDCQLLGLSLSWAVGENMGLQRGVEKPVFRRKGTASAAGR